MHVAGDISSDGRELAYRSKGHGLESDQGHVVTLNKWPNFTLLSEILLTGTRWQNNGPTCQQTLQLIFFLECLIQKSPWANIYIVHSNCHGHIVVALSVIWLAQSTEWKD